MSRMGGGGGPLGGYSYRTVRDIVFEGLSVQRMVLRSYRDKRHSVSRHALCVALMVVAHGGHVIWYNARWCREATRGVCSVAYV